MKYVLAFIAGCFLAVPLTAADDGASDSELWNEGVGYYRSGDVTNALRVLRPLLLSRTHGARAAEVVAKLEYDRGELEEAASAAQIALRADPDDAKANRNFTRCIDPLPSIRATKHVNEVLKAAEGKDPGSLLASALKEARAVMLAAGGLGTDSPERAVSLSDSLSARALKLVDAWLPVREVIAQSVTNAEQAATITMQIDAAKAKTEKAAKALADLDTVESYPAMAGSEHDFTRFFKMVVMPPAAVEEGLIAQSNAWQDVAAFNGRAWQREALEYTRCFRSRFPAWARAYEQQAQADTNKPPFTAEMQAKISALATEVEKLQLECIEKALPPNQESALRMLEEIRELLPKDKSPQSGSGGGSPPQDQQRNPPEDQKDEKNKNDGNPEGMPPPGEDEAEDAEDDDSPDDGDADGEEPDEEVETVLKKAQERSDEHDEEKKARMRKAPLPPDARDW